MKRWFLIYSLCLPGLLPAESSSAAGTIAAPVLGYFSDTAAQRLRSIQGIPGASVVGEALPAPGGASIVAISSERDFALGADGQAVTMVSLPSGATSVLPGATPGADRIVLSPGSKAAALYHSSGRTIEVLTGLPAAPNVARTVTTQGLPDLAAIAVSDDGQMLLAVPGATGRTVLLLDNGFLELPVPGNAAALAFRPQSQDAVVVTASRQIWLVHQGGRGGYDLIGDGVNAVTDPVAAEYSSDGSRVFVANADGAVGVFDFAGGNPLVVTCSCSPTALVRLKGNSLFLLQDTSSAVMKVFDGGSAAPRVFFVPAPHSEDNDR